MSSTGHGLAFAEVTAAEAGSPQLRDDLLETWVAVTDAGGSVGFVAPAERAAVALVLDAALDRVIASRDALGVLRRGGRSVGMGLLVSPGSDIQRHWRTVLRLMVHPDLQRIGAGSILMDGLHQMARQLGLEQLQLTVRAGEGLERFYERFGYVVVGSHPGALRVAPGDDRDEVMMVVRL